MGLDQYAYAAARAGQYDEFWQGAERDATTGEMFNSKVSQPREIAYWRKHPNLQGWMEQLWIRKGYPGLPENGTKFSTPFNGIELELTWQDIDELEKTVTNGLLPTTRGFFFGDDSDAHYREHDLAFVRAARADLFLGLRVFYNSSW